MRRSTILLLALPLVLLAFACGGSGESLPFGLRSTVVTEADHVSAFAFAPDGRVFIAEQYTGAIKIVGADGKLQPEPFAQLQVASYPGLDWGITGLALDPGFQDNHYLYAFISAPTANERVAQPTLLRLTEQDGKSAEQRIISDQFPPTEEQHAWFNANGDMHFGPDGFLYLSVGDYDDPPKAQDLTSPIGKLLRVSKEDGTAAPGNPLAGQPATDGRVFAHGFREPFPFAFQPDTGAIYGTDNTPYTCEELNLIAAGGNYSWPAGEFPFADCSAGGQTPAIHYFAREGKQAGDYLSFVEVSGLAFVKAAKYSSLGDSLIVCESQKSEVDSQFSPGVLRRLTLSGPKLDQVSADDVLTRACKGGVATAPDGTLYYATDKEVRKLETGSRAPVPAPFTR